MHIANYHDLLTFIEVTICGMPHVTRVLKLFLKFAVFYAKHVNVYKIGPFRVSLHHILTVFSDF